MERKICKTCGSELKRVGNLYVCEACDNTWEVEEENDHAAIKLASAWEALRRSEFDQAAELFEELIIGNDQNYEAYWGKALAQNGIIFVTDLHEHKKVPTCNNITEYSFPQNRDVQKAISLAPSEIADNYRQLADKIERIRIEWLEKASKEQPYDVFICFKDSDKDNGIERTQDSYAAEQLYTFLVTEGYRVFFSRVSLRDKVSEHYEPYIYNAIKTAKVMVVYGQKPSYFSSPWLKNEWSRYIARMAKGEKHKNSLIVAYENMTADELPVVLKSRQCMNAGERTFYVDISRHVKKVIELSQQNVHLDRIKVEGGQIAKKATRLSVNAVQTREIGTGAIAETDISEKQTVGLIQTYLKAKSWNEAGKLIEEVLFQNPGCAEAVWCEILWRHKTEDENAFFRALEQGRVSFSDFARLEKLLNCASKSFASHILNRFYQTRFQLDAQYAYILAKILPYSYPEREQRIQDAFSFVIDKRFDQSFDLLLETLASDEVERYISYNLSFAKGAQTHELQQKYLGKILSVDEGNLEALRLKIAGNLVASAKTEQMVSDLEALLKYTDNADREVKRVASMLASNHLALNEPNVRFMKQLLRYYSGSIADLKEQILGFAGKVLKTKMAKEAEYYYNLILSLDKNNADAYWGICLSKIGVSCDEEILRCVRPIKKCPEFNKYLTLVDEKRRLQCIQLVQGQNQYIEQLIRQTDDKIQKRKVTIQKTERANEDLRYKIKNMSPKKACPKSAKVTLFCWLSCVLLLIAGIGFALVAGGDILSDLLHSPDTYMLLQLLAVPVAILYMISMLSGIAMAWKQYESILAVIGQMYSLGLVGVVASFRALKASKKEARSQIEFWEKEITTNQHRIQSDKEELQTLERQRAQLAQVQSND